MSTTDDLARGVWPGVAARAAGRTLRIGHKGADGVVPGNTLASVRRAAALGCDAVEIDALPASVLGAADAAAARAAGHGPVRLAHDDGDLRRRPDAPDLEDVLDLLAEPDHAHLGVMLDVKWPGAEAHLVACVRARGQEERVLLSTMEPTSLRALRRLAPEIRLAWSVPRLRRDPFARRRDRPVALAGVLGLRASLPGLLARAIERGHVDAAVVHHLLLTRALVRRVGGAGEVHAWTVDEHARAAALVRMGVTGVISNVPQVVPRDPDGASADRPGGAGTGRAAGAGSQGPEPSV